MLAWCKSLSPKKRFVIYAEASIEMLVALPLMHELPCVLLILISVRKETSANVFSLLRIGFRRKRPCQRDR